MARKRGGYQRRKERENKISSVFCTTFFLFVILLFLYGLIQSAVNVRDIDHNSLNTYTGSYEYRVKIGWGRHSRLTYVFTLNNGDVFLINSRSIENVDLLDNYEELSFQYSTMYSNPLYGRYSAVSITSTDGDVVFASAEQDRKDSILSIWVASSLLLIFIPFFVLWIFVAYADHLKRLIKKWRNKKRRKREESHAITSRKN